VSAALDRAATLAPGRGHIDLTAYATLERAGAALDFESTLRPGLSAFAQAWAGMARDDRWQPDAGVQVGARWRW
jgi:hypothetical protein